MTPPDAPAETRPGPAAGQLAASADGSFWDPEDWELPPGATSEADEGQATIMLLDVFAVPKRVQLRITSCAMSDSHHGSAQGPRCHFSCVGRFLFKSGKWPDRTPAAFHRTTGRSASLAPGFNADRRRFYVVTGDPIEAVAEIR